MKVCILGNGLVSLALAKALINEDIFVDIISRKKKIKIMFSVFDNKSLNFVNKLNLEYIKLPSGEINNLKLINELNLSKSNIIFSSGASNLNDIQNCLTNLNKRKKLENIILMHCNSDYPTDYNDVNLNVLEKFKKDFNLEIGYSDHTKDDLVPIACAVKQINYLEKHIKS